MKFVIAVMAISLIAMGVILTTTTDVIGESSSIIDTIQNFGGGEEEPETITVSSDRIKVQQVSGNSGVIRIRKLRWDNDVYQEINYFNYTPPTDDENGSIWLNITVFENTNYTHDNGYKCANALVPNKDNSIVDIERFTVGSPGHYYSQGSIDYVTLTDYGLNATWGENAQTKGKGYVSFSAGSLNQLPKTTYMKVTFKSIDWTIYAGKGTDEMVIDTVGDYITFTTPSYAISYYNKSAWEYNLTTAGGNNVFSPWGAGKTSMGKALKQSIGDNVLGADDTDDNIIPSYSRDNVNRLDRYAGETSSIIMSTWVYLNSPPKNVNNLGAANDFWLWMMIEADRHALGYQTNEWTLMSAGNVQGYDGRRAVFHNEGQDYGLCYVLNATDSKLNTTNSRFEDGSGGCPSGQCIQFDSSVSYPPVATKNETYWFFPVENGTEGDLFAECDRWSESYVVTPVTISANTGTQQSIDPIHYVGTTNISFTASDTTTPRRWVYMNFEAGTNDTKMYFNFNETTFDCTGAGSAWTCTGVPDWVYNLTVTNVTQDQADVTFSIDFPSTAISITGQVTSNAPAPDTNPPTWDQTPVDLTYEIDNAISVTYNATDDTGMQNIYLNDTTYLSISSCNGTAGDLQMGCTMINGTYLNIDTYFVNVTANDTSGNTLGTPIKITVQDSLPPTWNQTPTDQTYEYFTGFLSYQVNATDQAKQSVTYSLNDTTYFSIDPASGLIQNKTNLDPDVYGIEINVTDPNSNTLSQAITVTVQDTTAPTWNQTPTDQVYLLGTAFSYQVNATDTGDRTITYGLNDSTNFQINSASGLIENITGLGAPVYYLRINATDPSGNELAASIGVASNIPLAWNQTATDWNDLEIDRFGNFSLQLNATGSTALTYSDNSSDITTDSSSGLATWKPDSNFVGVVWVAFNASNTTNQITNEVKITVNYVNFYNPPGNVTNIGGLITYANEVSNFRFGVMVLVALFAVAFFTLMMFTTPENAFMSASFITMAVATIMNSQGWISGVALITLIIFLGIGMVVIIIRRRG